MKQLLLATFLIALPVALFGAAERWTLPHPVEAAVAASALGDLQALKTIVTDVQTITATGDLAKAAARITDLESAWDDAEPTMHPLNPEQWGNVDGLIDTALKSLRAATPAQGPVTDALTALQAGLDNPGGGSGGGTMALVQGVPVTDAAGHPLPCESMITAVRDTLATVKLTQAAMAPIDDLLAKATERCNADDDVHADAFSAAALALLGQ